MHTTNLRKVGGSVMLAVSPAMLDLNAGAKVDMAVEEGRLIVQPQSRPRYTLHELLAQCDAAAEHGPEDCDWLFAPAVGTELI